MNTDLEFTTLSEDEVLKLDGGGLLSTLYVISLIDWGISTLTGVSPTREVVNTITAILLC